MQFLFQPLTWGFLLVGVPILVHLINMIRHRKRPWAAMEFLLESHRKNRRWVLLKQWLLLASRILAMALLVAMLAKWVSGAQWLAWFGGQTTHHYILLDDSLSMNEREKGETAYQSGLQALGGLVRSIAGLPGQHQVTLLRWSRAELALRADEDQARVDAAADLLGQSVPQDPTRLLDRINATQPTGLQLSPLRPLELVLPLIAESPGNPSEIYLVTDLRRKEFGEVEELKLQLEPLADNSKIHLIDCAHNTDNNLSLVSMEPEQEVWATQVPFMVRFEVRNRAQQNRNNVVVRLRAVSYGPESPGPNPESAFSGDVMELPPIVIESIAAGETVSRQVQVVFGLPGNHVIEASLDEDALLEDNRRWCTVQIKTAQRVLLVDNGVDQQNAFFFQSVVKPDARLTTGMETDIVDGSYLRDVAAEVLEQYDVVALLDVPRLDQQAIDKLRDYGQQGGGIFVMCGKNTNANFVNSNLVPSGLFPAELVALQEFAPGASSEPVVAATEHTVLGPLTKLQSSAFGSLILRQYWEMVPLDEIGSNVESIADLTGRGPLVVDHGLGQGRVITVLTGITNDWSNWARDPTFVVLTLRSFGYLASFRREPTSQLVGNGLRMSVAQQTVLPEAEVIAPSPSGVNRVRYLKTVDESSEDNVARLDVDLRLDSDSADMVTSLLRPGLFEMWMVSSEGDGIVKNIANNPPAIEGDLEQVTRGELESSLGGLPVSVRSADAISNSGLGTADSSQSTSLLMLLAALLLIEQVLAYSASYHSKAATASHAIFGRRTLSHGSGG